LEWSPALVEAGLASGRRIYPFGVLFVARVFE
jgi:hypothetical protein